jgi:myo-inositol-1(or 4)-monophosphatase
LNWYKILKEAAESAKEAIKPFIGLKEAGESLGKGAGGDSTKRIDRIAEEAIIEALNSYGISCILISEECGMKNLGKAPSEFLIIDPIDGTLNALRKVNFYCTSLTVSKNQFLSGVYAGLIMNLIDGSIYYAEKNKGAFLNQEAIHTSNVKDLRKAMVGLDLCFLKNEALIKRITSFLTHVNHMRHFGANALELCQVASGITDAFIDVGNRTVDISAGQLIVKEAGGLIVSLNGEELDSKISPKKRVSFIAAANPCLCRKILKLFSSKDIQKHLISNKSTPPQEMESKSFR